MATILLVEDQAHLRTILKVYLQKHDYRVDEAPDLETAGWKIEQTRYDVIILDLKLPDGSGISLLDKHPVETAGRTIVITANATVPSVVEAIKKGAFNYMEKPVDKELLAAQVKRIIEINTLKREHQVLIDEVASNFTFDHIIYESRKMDDVISRAKVLAKTGNTILLMGETGSGKEVLSHSIHNGSARSAEIFLPINCASVPAELFESELFGFEKGAFTGAGASYGGRFIQADKGTLFLDEIGELPIHIQAKLLRVLDDGAIYPLKAKHPVKVDVRLIAATNRDLTADIKLKQFRKDLYYRLKEASIVIPPLRDRVEDILPLIRHFIGIYNRVYKKNITRISAEAEKYFLTYSWEGNVRELKNTIKSIIPFKTNNTIKIEDLSYSLIDGSESKEKNVLTLAECEKRHLARVLKLTDFNILRTAELLGISRPRIYRKMKEYELEVDTESQ